MKKIILFTRLPLPGKTKTRLVPGLGAQGAAKVHRALLEDLLRELQKVEARIYVAQTPRGEETLFEGFHRLYQGEGSLNERMHSVFSRLHSKGGETLLIGSDLPLMKAEVLEEAFDALLTKNMVFQPTLDGGYCLLGMASGFFTPTVFQWESYRDILAALKKEKISVAELSAGQDLDTYEDFLRLAPMGGSSLQSFYRKYCENRSKTASPLPMILVGESEK